MDFSATIGDFGALALANGINAHLFLCTPPQHRSARPTWKPPNRALPRAVAAARRFLSRNYFGVLFSGFWIPPLPPCTPVHRRGSDRRPPTGNIIGTPPLPKI